MTALLMVYLLAVGSLLAVAAAVGERGLRNVGWAGRWPWIAAIVGMVVIPAWGIVGASPDVAVSHGIGAAWPASEVPAGVLEMGWYPWESLSGVPAVLDTPARLLWTGSSLGFLVLLLAGLGRLRLERAGWERLEVDGATVRVSRDTGPAVVGIFRPEIVVPAWAPGASAEDRAWILAHEQEHIRARDPLLLGLAGIVLLLMPWNPAVWWCFGRLRLAVEVDCDGRVLGSADVPVRARYGSLLLRVGGSEGALLPLPAAFAGRASLLERRLRLMTRSRPTGRVTGRVAPLLVAGLVLAVGACRVPAPDRPTSPTGPDEAVDVPPASLSTTTESEETPRFTPFTVAPVLANTEEVTREIDAAYPASLRAEGVGGRVQLLLHIDGAGEVVTVRVDESSGHAELDRAAVQVARTMAFEPALNRDQHVPVWIRLPMSFGTR